MATPNMNLSLPTVSSTPGPLWASNINAALTTVDSHNHTSGNGVQIPSSGLNINGDLSFNSNNATTLRSVRFGSQTSPLSLGTDLGCLYNVNGNLYWNSGAGAQVQLTVGNALNATSIGGIGGDYTTSTASVFYTSGVSTFTFWRSSNVNANLDVAQVKIRYPSAGAYYCGLNASASMVADVNLTLPTSLPGSQKFMTLDSSGNIASPWAVDGSTLEVASGTTVQMKDGGTTRAKLNLSSVFIAPTIQKFLANTSYTFTVSGWTASIGDVYQTNGQNFTVTTAISGGTQLVCSYSGTVGPLSTGTLTKISGAAGSTSSGSFTAVSGSSTYTLPANVRYIKVKMVGGGAGGAGGSGNNGGAGGNTTFGTLTANSGSGSTNSAGQGGAGGASVSIPSGWSGISIAGASGDGVKTNGGGAGGSSFFGGAGGSGSGPTVQTSGQSAALNSGSGGGGGGSNSSGGAGGGAGAYIEVLNVTPSASYSCSVGTAGVAGTGGVTSGGNGGSGIIIVEEYYQ